jgi:hypothetical protein
VSTVVNAALTERAEGLLTCSPDFAGSSARSTIVLQDGWF